MTASAATLEQLAWDVARTKDPDAALRALRALRGELDNLEPQLVLRALRAGASWSQIARSLGVSKQAAHRKHRHLTATASGHGDANKILVTSEARRSVAFARVEAEGLGQPAVGTEHLLLGILRCRRSHAVTALNALGVSYERALAALHTTMPGATPPPARAAAEAPEDGVSPSARRILEGSLREAIKHGDGYIGVEHLLLALLSDSRNGAVQTLEQLRVTPRQVREQIALAWTSVAQASDGGAAATIAGGVEELVSVGRDEQMSQLRRA